MDDPIEQILCFKCDLRKLNEKYVNNHVFGSTNHVMIFAYFPNKIS